MQLDWMPGKERYVLRVPRNERELVQCLMKEHGWDFSEPASTLQEACLFTADPYAALAHQNFSKAALNRLASLKQSVDASWAKETTWRPKFPSARNGDELWPFQRAGVEYALSRPNALIGDQPGLGKTAQGISIANEISAERVLVICPANIRLQWASAIRNWYQVVERPVIYPILKSKDGVHPKANWTVISYDLARSESIHRILHAVGYDLLILDEAHFLKSIEARRTRAVFGGGGIESIAESVGKVVALTGTPLPNRPRECYTLARGLAWESIDYLSEAKFSERYNPSAVIEKRDERTGVTKRFVREKVGRAPELQNRLRANFMVRRMKRDVLTQLPAVRYEIVHLEKDGEVKKALEAERMLDINPESLAGVDMSILGHISVVRRQMGLAKAPQVADYVEMLIDGGEEKLFLVGWHIDVLNVLQRRLERYGLVRVDGSTAPRRRELAVDTFVSDPAIRIFLGNIQAIGIGVDRLQKVCSHMVGAECSWTPGENEQVVDRLHRIGQSEGVLAEWMVVPGSFDERILGSAIRKLKNIDAALDKVHY